jgi:hypothetical protein
METLLGHGYGSRGTPEPAPLTHVEEQNALRDETISAFHKAVSDNEDSEDEDIGGGLLTLREKTKDELEREEEDYRAYLEREVGSVKDLLRLVDGPETHADDGTEMQADVKDAGPSDTNESGKKKKKSKRSQDQKEETDQDFLIKYAEYFVVQLHGADKMLQLHTESRLDRPRNPTSPYVFRNHWGARQTRVSVNSRRRKRREWGRCRRSPRAPRTGRIRRRRRSFRKHV